MSNRRRTGRRPPSYATRLRRRPDLRAPRRWPGWRRLRRSPWLVAVPAVAAEAGHLATAFVEWPESTARGAYHILAGALLGLVAATVRTGSGRLALPAGAAVAIGGPVVWLGGTLLGAPPYAELPVPAAAGVTAGELALAAILGAAWLAARPAAQSDGTPTRTPARTGPRSHPA